MKKIKNRSWRFIAIPVSLAIMIAIVLLVDNLNETQMAGESNQDPEYYAPGQTQEQNQPTTQDAGTLAIPPLPESQKGLKPEQAQTYLQVNADLKSPAYQDEELKVRAGEIVSLTYVNDSAPRLNYLHNWVLVRPGMEGQVMTEAQRAGPQRDFTPSPTHILARTTRLIPAGDSETIFFKAPSQPGEYTYLCTFPGHGAEERGVLKVEE